MGLVLVVALYPDAASTADDVVVPHQTDTRPADHRRSSP
jgi:hypothetical protein